MPTVEILITIDTDPVPGEFHEPEDFVRFFQHEIDRFPVNYYGRVELKRVIHPCDPEIEMLLHEEHHIEFDVYRNHGKPYLGEEPEYLAGCKHPDCVRIAKVREIYRRTV